MEHFILLSDTKTDDEPINIYCFDCITYILLKKVEVEVKIKLVVNEKKVM